MNKVKDFLKILTHQYTRKKTFIQLASQNYETLRTRHIDPILKKYNISVSNENVYMMTSESSDHSYGLIFKAELTLSSPIMMSTDPAELIKELLSKNSDNTKITPWPDTVLTVQLT